MSPKDKVTATLDAWPGSVAAVAARVGVSRTKLLSWAGRHPAAYAAPTEQDAQRVTVAVQELLWDALHSLP